MATFLTYLAITPREVLAYLSAGQYQKWLVTKLTNVSSFSMTRVLCEPSMGVSVFGIVGSLPTPLIYFILLEVTLGVGG